MSGSGSLDKRRRFRSTNHDDDRRIRWAPMLPTGKLIQLYEQTPPACSTTSCSTTSAGGCGIDSATSSRDERKVRCPSCGTEFQVRTPERGRDDVVPCPGCDWTVTDRAWHKSWEHRDLNGVVSRVPALRRQVAGGEISTRPHAPHRRSRARAPRRVARRHPGNFAARNFLEGSRPKIVALLEELAYGPGSHIAEGARARWQEAQQHYRSGR